MAEQDSATPEPATPEGDTPADTPSDEGTPEGVEVQDDLETFLNDEGDDLDEPSAEPATPSEGQEAKEEKEKPPVEAPPDGDEVPPAEQKQEEVPKPPETPPPEQATPPAPEETPPVAQPPAPSMEEVRQQYQESRAEMEKLVASQHYNLSEEQVRRMDDGDEALIPELMAKVYMDAVTGAVAHMITHLPDLVGNVLNGRDTSKSQEAEFFGAWPQLDREKHGDVVQRLGVAYRQLFPNAPAEDFIRDVGAQAMVALKIMPETPEADAGQPPPASPPPPFQPAGTGSRGAASTGPTNPFEKLADEMAAEELDLD